MKLKHRIDALEREMETLKAEIRGTLLAVQESLEKKSAGASSSRWQKNAWGLALLNMLIAITLFANIHFYTLESVPFDINPTLGAWLRAFWLALALLWLVLQMYPLALLLEQEDQRLRGVALRNAVRLFISNPSLTVLLTLLVLVVAVVSMLFPAAWFFVVLALLVVVCINVGRRVLALSRRGRRQSE